MSASTVLLHHGRKHLFHGDAGTASWRGRLLQAAISPDGMGDAAKRRQSFVVALLIAVVDGVAGEESVAVVLIGACGAHAEVGRKALAAVGGLAEKRIGLEAEAGRVIARVIERDVHVAGYGIHGHPLIEAIHREAELVGDRRWVRPGIALVVREGEEDVT